ncbi:MAG: prenyltransferase [Methanomassiliicoccus sp.]|nr:prenyltransferase [Methanomassiliicoccus sp.]
MEENLELTTWQKVKEVLRIAYTLPFVLASVVGVVFALTVRQEALISILIPLTVLFLALFVNFSNDYFDHRSGVDKLRFSYYEDEALRAEIAQLFNQKVFWSGNALDRGIITEAQGKVLMTILAIGAVLLAIPIILYAGWLAVALGLVGLALAFFYTAPPINLGARGLGEIDVLVSFAMMAFFSYFVIAQTFSWPMLFLSLAIGLGAMLMRLSDEAPGYPSHVAKGEKNLLVRFGLDNIGRIEAALIAALYLCVLSAAVLEPFLVILFLVLPLPIRALRILRTDSSRIRLWKPIPLFLKQTVGLEVLAIIALIARIAWTSL